MHSAPIPFTIPLNLLRSVSLRSPHQPGARNFQLLATSFHGEGLKTLSYFCVDLGISIFDPRKIMGELRMNMRGPTGSHFGRFK